MLSFSTAFVPYQFLVAGDWQRVSLSCMFWKIQHCKCDKCTFSTVLLFQDPSVFFCVSWKSLSLKKLSDKYHMSFPLCVSSYDCQDWAFSWTWHHNEHTEKFSPQSFFSRARISENVIFQYFIICVHLALKYKFYSKSWLNIHINNTMPHATKIIID